MDFSAPVSSVMSSNLKTAGPEDEITLLDTLFKHHRIHHVPVVEGQKIVGIVSKSDFLYFIRGFTNNDVDRFIETARMRAFKVQEIMVRNVETIRSDETVKKAITILAENRFRCLPVIDAEENLVGIITTHDIIDLVKEEASK